MAGSFSNYWEDLILDFLLGGGVLTPPAHVYVALYTVAPTDAGGGTEVTQVGGTDYARVEVDNDADAWPLCTPGTGAKANGEEIAFVEAGASWGEVAAFALFDSAIGGANNMLIWGDLTVHKTIGIGDTAKFAVGDIDLTLD
jgi:hypothetical protein